MERLEEYKNELSKCSKCGLCQAVCPVYKIYPNECVVSKGKFLMLYGVTKGELELSKTINKYLDMCLKCGKCTEFCPSSIDACKIFNIAKYQYSKGKFISKIINFAEEKLIFGILINFGKFISKPFRKKSIKHSNINVVYFKGCVNQICPKTDKYIRKIFKDKINIIEPKFECCGLPYLSEGNLEKFKKNAIKNINLLKNQKYNYFITDCASCESTILDYKKYISDFNFEETKSINWGDLISKENIEFVFKKPVKITFHKPCHLKNDDFFEKIISNCKNVEYEKMNNYDDCCGFAGSFSIKNPKLSQELSKIKAQNIKNTNADYVITTCPSCILGLKQGLFLTGRKTKVVSLLEFLSKADEIIYQG